MSCHSCSCSKSSCVCETVRKIVYAQNKVRYKRKCSGCKESIAQLKGKHTNTRQRHTTIPFVLYCKSNCRPFIAEGIQKPHNSICTPFLKAKSFVDDYSCCVRVELLCPVNTNGRPVATDGDRLSDYLCHGTPLFRATGVCLTLDLNDFNAIQCLDATTPLPRYHS